jgi:uncharacterized phage protein gp47/JayE
MRVRSINNIIDSIKRTLDSLGSPMAKFSSYSNLYILFRAIATVVVEQDVRLKEIIDSSFISTATGSYLDRRAADFGMYRLKGSYTTGSVLVKGPSVALSRGTILYTSDQTYQYEVGSSVTIPSTIEAVLTIKALGIGGEYNLPQGTFLYSNLYPNHSFVVGRYRDPITRVVVGSLSNGSSVESDSEFRSRIGSKLSGGLSQTGTIRSIREELLKLPYLTRVYIKEHTPITGYFTIFIDTQDSELIKTISSLVQSIKPIGVAFLVRPLRTKAIDVSVEVIVNNYQEGSISTVINRTLSSYFSSLSLGASINPTYIRDALISIPSINSVLVTKPSLPISLPTQAVADLGKVDISIRTIGR